MRCERSPLHQEVDKTPLWTEKLESKRRTELLWESLGTRRTILKEGFQGTCEMSPWKFSHLYDRSY